MPKPHLMIEYKIGTDWYVIHRGSPDGELAGRFFLHHPNGRKAEIDRKAATDVVSVLRRISHTAYSTPLVTRNGRTRSIARVMRREE
jgi:hypothetical protein